MGTFCSWPCEYHHSCNTEDPGLNFWTSTAEEKWSETNDRSRERTGNMVMFSLLFEDTHIN